MSFASTMNAIMLNNRKLRLNRKKLFDKDITTINEKEKIPKPNNTKHLSKSELETVREVIKEETRIRNLRLITLAIILVILVGIVSFLFFFYIDPDKINFFKRVEMFFSN